jgi:hypothetical protein
MLSKRVTSLLVVLAAVLACELYPTGAAAQMFSRVSAKAASPLTRSLSIPKSPRPLTPAEEMFASQHKNLKPRPRTTPGLPTSAKQIFKTAITSSSGGSETYNAATADLNGDGKLDVVMASQCSSNNCSNGAVTVLLGNGDGTYQTPVSYATGTSTRFVALSDVNGDGKLDILAANYCNSDCSSGTVSVLLGNGDGTFQPAVAYNTGTSSSIAMVVRDVNGDGKPDLLVLDQCVGSCASGGLSVLLGNGDGTFQTAIVYPSSGNSSQGIAAADLNGDGKLDVAIANACNNNSDCSSGSVSVFLGNGDGTFQNAVSVSSVGYSSNGLAIGDVNGDGHADLVVSNQCNSSSNCTSGTLSVALGNGNGTFQSAVQYPSGGLYTQSVALGDLNGDGKLDIVATNQCQSNSNCENGNSTSVLLGNGDGTFQLNASYAAGSSNFDELEGPSLSTVSLADTNGDGKLDVLVTNSCSGADFDCGSGAINVLLGYGDGTLQAGIIYSAPGSANGLATGDVNGDGKPDLVIANECNTDCSAGTVSILLNNGDGTFQTGNTYPSGGQYTLWAATGDVNGDGKADIVLSNQCGVPNVCTTSSVSVLLGNGDGTFQSATSYSLTSTDGESIVLGDVNGDGKLDIVVVIQCADNTCSGGAVDVLLGNGDGTFQPAVAYSSAGVYAIGGAIGDVNGDGKADIVLINDCNDNTCANGTAAVLLGNGDGTFQPAVLYSTGGQSANSMQLADINGDGKLDIVAENRCASNSNCSTGSLVVLLGNGDGTFQTGVATIMNSQFFFSQTLVVADFNGDQKLDVAFGGADTFLLGNGDGTFQAPMSLGTSGNSTVVADFNGDGRPDLAIGGVTILLNISDGFKVLTTTAVNSSSNPSSFGQSVTFTATVTPQVPGNPTGTVTFTDGATQLGQVTLANGAAAYTTSALGIGSHSITASYSGDSNDGVSTSTTLSQVVAIASTTTALSGAPNSANVGQGVTFTATVTPSSSGMPTGSVSFYDGGTLLGSSGLSAGVATYSTSSLSAATHSIIAVYSGDDDYSSSTSGTLSELVSAQSFTLSSTALSPATITAGGSAQGTITINPAGALNPSTVSLSCAVTPVVAPAVTCSASSVTVSNGVGSATLHVSTVAPHTAAQPPVAKQESGSGKLFLLALFIPGLALCGAASGKSNRGKLLGFGIALLVLSSCMFQAACGGVSSSGTPVPGTPTGAYTVTVTGTANGMQQTATVTLTVH